VQNVILGWLGRRALEVGGLAGTVLAAYMALQPNQQDIVNRILTGRWQDITLGAFIPFLIYIGSQVLSFRATVKPQVVTNDGKKIDMKKLPPQTRAEVNIGARQVAPPTQVGGKGVVGEILGGLRDLFVRH
jgi:hypothetical protein